VLPDGACPRHAVDRAVVHQHRPAAISNVKLRQAVYTALNRSYIVQAAFSG
jgi:ABC-type transport system substrate-binding protein